VFTKSVEIAAEVRKNTAALQRHNLLNKKEIRLNTAAVILVGTAKAIAIVVKNDSITRRNTGLALKLKTVLPMV
jgi:hypothetical protein